MAMVEFSREGIIEISKDRNEPQWLREFRLQSFEFFQKLPIEKSTLYKYKNLGEIKIDNLELDGASKWDFDRELLDHGLVLTDLSSAIEKDPEFFKKYFSDKLLKSEEDKFVALNNAFFKSGIFLQVPKNIDIKFPIRNILTLDKGSIFSQNIIIVEEGSRLTILEEGYSNSKESINSNLTEIAIKDNALAKFINFENFGHTINLVNRKAICGNDAKISWLTGFFGSDKTRCKIDSVLSGNGSEADDIELVFGNGKQAFDLTSNLIHRGLYTRGQARIKTVLKDSSRSILKGMVGIEKGAKKANSYLSEHAMLFSKEAGADAIPSLEIETDDVKATHSASVAQINPEQIFYLATRGLGDEDAKRLLVFGFFEPLIQQIPFQGLRKFLETSIELKWEGKTLRDIGDFNIFESEEEKAADLFEGHYKYR